MGINDLKAQAYDLAGVTTTRQLKAKYRAIAQLNLRLKVSWQQAIALLEANPVGDATSPQTIAELKAEVYELAQVSSTQQLKAKYEPLGQLNFSFKASWQQALALIKAAPQNFQAWLTNPPEEYKALFAEIETVSDDFNTHLEKAKQLGREAHAMATSLEELAQDAQAEADDLRSAAEAAAQLAQQARLN